VTRDQFFTLAVVALWVWSNNGLALLSVSEKDTNTLSSIRFGLVTMSRSSHWLRRCLSPLFLRQSISDLSSRQSISSRYSGRPFSSYSSQKALSSIFSRETAIWAFRRGTAPLFRSSFYKRCFAISIQSAKFYFIILFIREHTIEARPSIGPSMLPTLADGGELNLSVNLSFYKLLSSIFNDGVLGKMWKTGSFAGGIHEMKNPSKAIGLSVGDLAVYTSPNDPRKDVCKRVIGLPGDTILIDPRKEPSPSHDMQWGSVREMQSQGKKSISEADPLYIVVPKGHIWTSGDNLANSIDSRHYGPVPLGLVKGKLMAKLWPKSSRSWIRNPLQEGR